MYPPEQLLAWGVIDRVLPVDQLHRESAVAITAYAAGPTKAYAATKRTLLGMRSGGIGAADKTLRSEAPDIFASEDAQTGIAAYLEGSRRDSYSGR